MQIAIQNQTQGYKLVRASQTFVHLPYKREAGIAHEQVSCTELPVCPVEGQWIALLTWNIGTLCTTQIANGRTSLCAHVLDAGCVSAGSGRFKAIFVRLELF